MPIIFQRDQPSLECSMETMKFYSTFMIYNFCLITPINFQILQIFHFTEKCFSKVSSLIYLGFSCVFKMTIKGEKNTTLNLP